MSDKDEAKAKFLEALEKKKNKGFKYLHEINWSRKNALFLEIIRPFVRHCLSIYIKKLNKKG